MESGRVLWWKKQAGYGFIRCPNRTDDIFVHFQGIKGEGFKELFEGQNVEFELGSNRNGPCAINLVVVK